MRTGLVFSTIVLTLLAAASQAIAQQPKELPPKLVPADRHVWGRFPVGSWNRTRTVIETYDDKGGVATSIRETKSTLKRVEADGFVLVLEHMVEVGGRRYPQVPQELWVGFNGQTKADQDVKIDSHGAGDVQVNGRKIPCEVRRAEIQAEGGRRTVTIHYSPEVFPFVLKRETAETSAAGGEPVTTTEEIVAAGLRQRLLGELHSVSHMRTIHRSRQNTKVTMEILCDDVPGGIAEQSTQEFNDQGKVVRRTTLELTDFEIFDPAPSDPRTGRPERRRFFHRKRADDGMPNRRRP